MISVHKKQFCFNQANDLKTLIINELEQTSSKWISEKRLSKKLFVSQYTKIDKAKTFCVIHDKVTLLAWRCSEWGTRNLHQRIFRKVLTIRKRWSKDEFFMTLKLILAFFLTDLSQHFRIQLMVFAVNYFIDGHVGKR